MFHHPLMQKAWNAHHQAKHAPVEVLLEATIWLEEKFQQTPNKHLASALELHHLLLAMRRAQTLPTTAQEHVAHALHWQKEAERMPSAQQLLSGSLTVN